MLTYNTQQKRLILPEYGRNIQQMVDHCLTIKDRDERTTCAKAIIRSMGNLFPELRNNEDNNKKLWDHLSIMSDFKLDVDFPCEIVRQESLNSRPLRVEYHNSPIRYMHYGKNLEMMIARASEMEEGEERDALVLLLANHMKKMMLAVNPDGVDDAKIFKDLAMYSHGAIRLNTETCRLHEFKAAPTPATGKKKKKK
ncbi:MAG: DUF4290 domain-containing protein [Muribaculaceae bacterium]|nr:DUF4290 domain-containing protein [Muribaculaceae bacterium]